MAAIIDTLGFTLYSDLIKTRQKAHYNTIEICLDEVENLGTFIEAEKLTEEDSDGSIIVEELRSELEKIGVDRSNEVFDGYDVLLKRKLASDQ